MIPASLSLFVASVSGISAQPKKTPTDYVNPFLGTATLWDEEDLGFKPTHRAWGAEVFPGASLPNAMVQLTPVTQFHSGSGYQYEDTKIEGFAHTSKGHWNLCHIPILAATGDFTADDHSSPYSHDKESAHPGYYQVYLQRYGINAELTSTLRCGFHKYTFQPGADRKLIVDLSSANERVRAREIHQAGDRAFSGFQQLGEKMYFYAVANQPVEGIATMKGEKKEISVVSFGDSKKPLELQIGFSFVSVENAKENLEHEMLGKTFAQVRKEATRAWQSLLSQVKITGGTERQRGLFYSCLYRSFLWPALRSDRNGDFVDVTGKVVNKGFNYYTEPSLWDDYRNKLVLLGMLTPKVSEDVIQSLIDKGAPSGFMPTFFHGDHAAAYVAGTYLRGIKGFDVHAAYKQLIKNATVEGGTRPHIAEYMEKGYISEPDLKDPKLETVANAGVTKTLEYAYDDYAVALLAKALDDPVNYAMLMKRTSNYKNVFDKTTEFMRGRLANGEWIKDFDPTKPFYEYMYREANAWQSTFFAPHDPEGLVALFKSKEDLDHKLDQLFTIPYTHGEADNLTGFIGQYCHGNQPDHTFAFMYYFVGKQEKSQAMLNRIMDRFYDMGKDRLAYAGMDDAGEMSSWYVFTAMGMYPFSPADPEYLVSVPLFDKVEVKLGSGQKFTIRRPKAGTKIKELRYDKKPLTGYTITHDQLLQGKELVVAVE